MSHLGLYPYGWSERVADLVAEANHSTDGSSAATVGRVTRVDNTHAQVQTDAGSLVVPMAVINDHDPGGDRLQRPTTGDWLLLDTTAEPPSILAMLPRWSTLARGDALGRAQQVLAADVDLVFVVQGLDRPLKLGRIERSLALAYDAGAVPVIVLSKSDLAGTTEAGEGAPASAGEAELALRPVARDVEIVVASVVDNRGLDRIRTILAPGITAALIGESGAGKSTLVNALAGSDLQGTTDVRPGDAKGRHTTTTRDLIPVPGGGVLLDTPGLRSLGLWDANEGVARVFDDLEELADLCRFADCEHRTEPGCAVLGAVERGEIDRDRVDRWLAFIDELDAQALRKEEQDRELDRMGRAGARTSGGFNGSQHGGRQRRNR